MKLLTPKQRSTLSAMAREAYQVLAPGLSETADEFRHAESRRITAKLPNAPAQGWKISEAPKSAFDALFDHFKVLKGEPEAAFDRKVQDISSEMRNMLHNITVAERAAGVGPRYTSGICQRMFRTDAPRDLKQAKAVLAALTKKIGKAAAAAENGELRTENCELQIS